MQLAIVGPTIQESGVMGQSSAEMAWPLQTPCECPNKLTLNTSEPHVTCG